MAQVEIAKEEITSEEREKIEADLEKIVQAFEKEHMRVKKEVTEPPKIVYCMTIYEERMEQVLTCLNRVRPYVDRCVIVVDDSVTKKSKILLCERGCEVFYRKWDNHFSKQRNEYLNHVNEGEWVLVSDPDELHSESLMKDIHTVVLEAEKREINMLGINSHDILVTIEGKREETVSTFFKNILFRFEEGVRYVGVVHETLLPGVHGWRVANLDKRYYYEHIKKQVEIWERAARNFHIAGGGNNLKEQNPIWREYRKIVEELELSDWPKMRTYLRKGKIDLRMKVFLVKHRNRNVIPDADTEIREYFRWYFEVLHPEENIRNWKSEPEEPPKGSWGEIRNFVEECYMQVLGRHADETGKNMYTQAILNGKVKREDLANLLKNSPEYKMKQRLKEEPISVGAVVLARNEEKNIKDCLNHLKPHVDFLAVLAASETNDKTIEIAKAIADVVVVRPFSGSFAEERNRAHHLMTTNWILHCDADERFDRKFLVEMKNIIKHGEVLAFRFPRINPDKRDFPDYQVRLLRKEAAEWKGKYGETPFDRRKNKPIDQTSIKSLDNYPITHHGEKKDWEKIIGENEAH